MRRTKGSNHSAMRRQDEQTLAALCHFFNAVPIWGLLFCGFIWYDSREKSRHLVGQARQGMLFHGVLLAALLVWIVVELFVALLSFLLPPLGILLHLLNSIIVWVLVAAYAAVCIWGGTRVWAGEEFNYPFIGEAGN